MPASSSRTIVVPQYPRDYDEHLIYPPLRWPVGEVGMSADYSLDLADVLLDVGGDTITTISFAIAPSGDGELQANNLAISGSLGTVWLVGGVAGRQYLCQMIVTFLSSRVIPYYIGIQIDPTLAVYPPVAPPVAGFGTPIIVSGGSVGPGPFVPGVVVGLTATGSDQATALLLPALSNVFSTVSAGTGARLFLLFNGSVEVVNGSETELLLYPNGTARINELSAGVPVVISPHERVVFLTADGIRWYAS